MSHDRYGYRCPVNSSIAFWCKRCKLKPLVYNMNVWGFPKIMGKGAFFFFFQGLMRKQGVHHLKNCENNSREALFFFSFLVTY